MMTADVQPHSLSVLRVQRAEYDRVDVVMSPEEKPKRGQAEF